MKRVLAVLAAGLTAVAVTSCGSSDPAAQDSGGGDGDGAIVIGSADFAESELIMEIYAAALEGAGLEVQTMPRLGSREITNRSLESGELTVMPEYSGGMLQSYDASAEATSPDEVFTALQAALPDGLEALEQAEAEDADVLVVTQETSDQYQLTSMDQLGPLCGQFVLGAAGEWPDRWSDRIAELYDCTFQRIDSTDAGGPVTLEALSSGSAQVVNLFTTSPDIEDNEWVALDDPQQMYPAQNIVPVVSAELDQAGKDALNEVSAALTTEILIEYNRRITVDRAVPGDLAQEFVDGLGG